MSDKRVISFGVFEAARFKKANAESTTPAPKPQSLRDTFVAFSADEQKDILTLHTTYSGASRDYNFGHEDGAALITLLACALTKEALVSFTKMVNDDGSAHFIAQGSVLDDMLEGQDLKALVSQIEPHMQAAQTARYAKNEELARQCEIKARRARFTLL